MTIESTEQQDTTTPAITYSECYAQVFLGDCLELYKNIEPKCIDLILTDLPYGTTACKWDTIIPFDKLWEMVNYLLKPNGAFITTASQPFTSALVMSNTKYFRQELIWSKLQGGAFGVAKYMPIPAHENILVFGKGLYNPQMKEGKPYKGKATERKYKNGNEFKFGYKEKGSGKNDTGLRYPISVIEIGSQSAECNNLHRQHPTQKPIALFEYLLKTYSNENMTIFDPCMGSGTTGVACKNTNRSFIGIEKDEAYFKIAEQRINARTLFS